jgi:hypothetical protein
MAREGRGPAVEPNAAAATTLAANDAQAETSLQAHRSTGARPAGARALGPPEPGERVNFGGGAGAGEGVSLEVVDVNHTQVEQLRTVPPDDSENE